MKLLRQCLRGHSAKARLVMSQEPVGCVARVDACQEVAAKWEADKEELTKKEKALSERWARSPRATQQSVTWQLRIVHLIAQPCCHVA